MTDDIRTLQKLLEGIEFAMLTTADERGELHSRPMATQQLDDEGVLWFFTARSSHKAAELDEDHHVNLSYSAPTKSTYVSVSGVGTLVDDRSTAEKLWNPMFKAWFAEGLEDPDLALLRVQVTRAHYWSSPSGKLVQLLGFVKAAITGKEYAGEGSENREVRLDESNPVH